MEALPCAFRPAAWTLTTRLSTPVTRLVGLNGRGISSRRSCNSRAGLRGKGPLRCPAAAMIEAPRSAGQFEASPAAAAFPVPEETVDGLAVTVEDGSIDALQFQAHDQAVNLLKELEEMSNTLSTTLDEGKAALNKWQWQGLTLPTQYQEDFKQIYRSGRKEEEKQKKEERKLRRLQRQQAADVAGDAVEAVQQQSLAVDQPQPWYAPQQQQQQQQQQEQSNLAERRARRAQQRQARDAAAAVAPAAAPAAQQPEAVQALPQQPMKQRLQQLQQQQQTAGQQQRQRRRRSSSAAGSTAAAVAPALAAAAAPTATATPAAASTSAVPADLQVSSSSSRQLDAEPPTANRGGPAGPRPAAAHMQLEQQQEQQLPIVAAASATPAAGAISSGSSSLALSSSSSSSSSSSRASPGLGFVPLLLDQPAAATPARAAVPRRTARAAGVRSPRTKTAAVAAAPAPVSGGGAVAPVSSYGKLGDNNINGLDMRVELLSAEQEKELALMVQDLLRLEEVARSMTQELGRLPTDLEWMEAAGCVCGDTDADSLHGAIHAFQNRLTQGRLAKQVMISANYKLVVSICRKYQGYGMAIGDLINEGIAGLVKGVERFEPTKGCKFSTYAHWWIRQSITRSLSEQGRLVRLPSHLQEMLTKMTKISRAYQAQYGKEATLEDLAKELGVEPSKISDAYEAVFTPRSLDQPMNDGEGATLGDVVEDERMMGSDEAAYVESLKHDLEGVLSNLPPREAGVLRMRFGLLDGTEHTLDEIGAQYNVTRERIRQIEAKAIRHLRSRQLQPGSVMADYQGGGMDSKQLASRTSSGTKKQG